ncbi:MAG: FAD-dependent oxidoreductase [Planctomycetota bacterium]
MTMRSLRCFLFLAAVLATAASAPAQSLLIEAESFDQHGGWKLDTQFIDVMGSPYLLAHGLGRPVEDAVTTVTLPELGTYRVFVRTKDWVARWKAPGTPGRFQLSVDDTVLSNELGTNGADWAWQDAGSIVVTSKRVKLALRDLTGFDGRCDAVYLTAAGDTPPANSEILPKWRREKLGLPSKPTERSDYDIVVIGGGYSGMGTALSAARMGCRVALIQNRPVLGGNGSSEVRVWSMGLIRRGNYPRVGEMIHELADSAKKSPGTFEEFEDAKKERVIRAEPNIDLFLNHHAYKVETDASGGKNARRIVAVHAFDTRSSECSRFSAPLFADCTGHGTIGFLAGADWDMTPNGRMGMSNMWAWAEAKEAVEFPKTPWALDLNMADFPYPRAHHGQWFWEGGFDKDPIREAEEIRDWNLRAVFGAFNAMKNRDGAAKHRTAYLTWIAFIGGPRESRRLMGDVVLTQDDIVTKREFPDGCVPSTWSIDLHYPKKLYSKKYPDNPFISVAKHDRRIDRSYGYPVPYRCFYSRNVENLFMAGRCISVTHEALGTTRVMKTCGMMGEVVGRAASVCIQKNCKPRDIYSSYWGEMDKLLKLPGKARRATVNAKIVVPDDALKLATPFGVASGLDPASLAGVVVDDRQAKRKGAWTEGTGLKGYVGWGYQYAFKDASIQFDVKAPATGKFDVRLAYGDHPNRAKTAPVVVHSGATKKTLRIDMTKKAPLEKGFISLGTLELKKGALVTVKLSTENAGGCVHADAVQLVPNR